jgi:hypothetical protein
MSLCHGVLLHHRCGSSQPTISSNS